MCVVVVFFFFRRNDWKIHFENHTYTKPVFVRLMSRSTWFSFKVNMSLVVRYFFFFLVFFSLLSVNLLLPDNVSGFLVCLFTSTTIFFLCLFSFLPISPSLLLCHLFSSIFVRNNLIVVSIQCKKKISEQSFVLFYLCVLFSFECRQHTISF